jgi:hypothetical protein
MARMIPPSIPSETPAGEKLLLRKLREDPHTQDWIVFHSVDIRKHLKRIEGEADLLVIIPSHGILCVEVKGCDVSRRDGLWIYPYGTSPVGPFRQAADAAHSLRRYVCSRDASLAGLMFFSAVAFTTIDFTEASPEWHAWQTITKTNLIRSPISVLLLGVMTHAHAYCRGRTPRLPWYDDRASRPTQKQTERLLQLLRGDFEYIESSRGAVDLAEDSIKRFTEEQFDAIDHLDENRCIFFKGPAGTGKTFLAIEGARRAVRSGRGTALVCFNSLLGEWLKRETATLAAEALSHGIPFFAGTLHALMLNVAQMPVPHDAGPKFWQQVLPERTVELLLAAAPGTPLFEFLLVDEAQDLMSDECLDVMELLLDGGFSGGRWAMFGDFERQAIYLRPLDAGSLDALRQRAGEKEVVSFPLRINCRNGVRISETLTITTGMSPGYKRVLNPLDAADVEPVFYRNAQHQQDLLLATISRLMRTFKPDQIIVLSMKADSSSTAAQLADVEGQIRLIPFRNSTWSPEQIRFASIHAFKGLESAAIIITDVERIDDEQSKSLLYVGMSRARIQLYVMMNERVRASYAALLDAGLKAAMGRNA